MKASAALLFAALLLIQSCHHHQPVLPNPDVQARIAEGGDSEEAGLHGVFRALGVEMAGRPVRLHPMWNAPPAVLSLEDRTWEIPRSLREAYQDGGGAVASWAHAVCTGPGQPGCEELRDLDLLWVADDVSWDGDRVQVRVGWVSFGGDGAVEVRREVHEYDCGESACQLVDVVDQEAPEGGREGG